jgi:hypothetical protein
MSFLKLSRAILTSTLWMDRDARGVFLTAALEAEPRQFKEPLPVLDVDTCASTGLVLPAGWYGFAEVSGPGIVSGAGYKPADPADWALGWAALQKLASPDPHSRTPDYEGRRLVRVAGGFIIINYMKYRDADHGSAERMRNLRARRKGSQKPSQVTHRDVTCDGGDVTVTQAEAEAEAYLTDPPTPLPDCVKVENSVEKGEEVRAGAVWLAACGTVALPEHAKVTWLRPTRALGIKDGVLRVAVPSAEHQAQLGRAWIGLIQQALGEQRVRFVIDAKEALR